MPINAQIYYDNYLVAGVLGSFDASAYPARSQSIIDVGTDFVSQHRNVSVQLTFLSDEQALFFEWAPSFFIGPELIQDRATDWTDCGTPKYKYIRGCRITADTPTTGQNIAINIETPEGLSFTAGGVLGGAKQNIYAFSWPPFKAHLVRVQALPPVNGTPNQWRFFNVAFDFDIEPELTTNWTTQPSTFSKKGYLHLRDYQFAYASQVGADYFIRFDTTPGTKNLSDDPPDPGFGPPWFLADIKLLGLGDNNGTITMTITGPDGTLGPTVYPVNQNSDPQNSFPLDSLFTLDDTSVVTITADTIGGDGVRVTFGLVQSSPGSLVAIVDGVSHTLNALLPSTDGEEIKRYYNAPPLKGKVWQFSAVGVLQVYQKDCEFRLKSWGEEEYNIMKFIGDDNFTSGGAKI